METLVKIAILGATGRMGRAVICEIDKIPQAGLSAALASPDSANIGADAGRMAGCDDCGTVVTSDLRAALNECDVLIDFSTPGSAIDAALMMHDVSCKAMVSGTTGFSQTEAEALHKAADSVALIRADNFSLGVNLLAGLVKQAARVLDAGWDAEVFEMHHNKKKDAPSGTALMLGQAIAEGREQDFDTHAVLARKGVGDGRKPGEIGFAALRGGSVIGDHDVHLASELEMITLSHRALDRRVFAAGAVRAALWAAKQPKGAYTMRDVLGL